MCPVLRYTCIHVSHETSSCSLRSLTFVAVQLHVSAGCYVWVRYANVNPSNQPCDIQWTRCPWSVYLISSAEKSGRAHLSADLGFRRETSSAIHKQLILFDNQKKENDV